MKLAEISLNSPSPRKRYIADLDACQSLEAWVPFLTEWEWLLSPRVAAQGRTLDEAGFQTFRVGLKKERRKTFAGEEWARTFLDFLIPARLMLCDDIADRFMVPWVVAWRRLEDTKQMPQ